MTYKSINMYLHDVKMHDKFIYEEIIPLQNSILSESGINNFILRHWRKGHHIQWHIEINDKFNNKDLQSLVQILNRNIEDYSAKNSLSEESLKKQYLMLKDFEMEVGEIFPIENDTSIKISDSEFRIDIWGKTGVESLISYYITTNGQVMKLINKSTNYKYRASLNMFLAAINALGDVERHQLSFRSHAEAFLNRFDKGDKLREQFEYIYTSNKSSLRTLMNIHSNEDVFIEWKKIFKDLIIKNKKYIDTGDLALPEADTYMKIINENNWDNGYEGSISDFHKYLNEKQEYDDITKSTDFKTKRLVLNFLYNTLAQIGIKPVEKFSMCYAISRYYEEKLGTEWKEQLDNVIHRLQVK